jgi:hypothetical protein
VLSRRIPRRRGASHRERTERSADLFFERRSAVDRQGRAKAQLLESQLEQVETINQFAPIKF